MGDTTLLIVKQPQKHEQDLSVTLRDMCMLTFITLRDCDAWASLNVIYCSKISVQNKCL